MPFVPSGFFVLRTPLLPFEELEGWSAAAGGDPVEARRRLREDLRGLAARPEVAEALFLASPSLSAALAAWREAPESKKGHRAEGALVRYLLRMAARATPFGLFAGYSLGTIAPEMEAATRLRLAPLGACRRRSRLDMDYLLALAEVLEHKPEIREGLRYRPNPTLYRAAGRRRYIETRREDGERSHHLVAVEPSPPLESVLARAAGGATPAELARAVVEEDGEIPLEDAAAFVGELIDCRLLVSPLAPGVTGDEPMDELVEHLGTAGAEAEAGILRRARDALAALDAGGLGAAPARYRALAGELGALPALVDLARLVQVDLARPAVRPEAGIVLGTAVMAEIEAGARLLHRLAPPPREDALSRFRDALLARYGEGRAVPLMEALDEEAGVGFGDGSGSGVSSPLLDGLAPPPAVPAPTGPWGAREDLLLRRVTEALRRGARDMELSDADLESLAGGEPPPLPDAFHAVAALAAPSEEALARGEFRLHIEVVHGPSGACLLGRFCHGDEALRRAVEAHLRREEELAPEAIFAEIVHLPEGRAGNVLARPALREHEIPVLGRGGAPESIPLADLLVSARGGEVVLHSQRLGRRVLPRLTSAHDFRRGLGVYRFLGALQAQGRARGLSWNWGPLARLPFLPRITYGRLVLARARWRLEAGEIRRLARGGAVARWRAERGLPRWVALVEGENDLLLDLDNPLCRDALRELAARAARPAAAAGDPHLLLREPFPPPEELCVRGPEGRFTHEIVIPFVRREPEERPLHPPAPAVTAVERTFPPGSSWLYARLYTGAATADRLLPELVAPLARRALAEGLARRWFFLRYGEPHWHLRLRFQGEPERLWRELLPRLTAAAAPFVARGEVGRWQLDTYEREVERYGGPEGVELAEEVARVDSEAVLEVLEALARLPEAEAAARRWRLALVGTRDLLADLLAAEGVEAAEVSLEALRRLRDAAAHKVDKAGFDAPFRRRLAARLRRERPALEALLATPVDAFARRSRRLAPLVAELRALHARGRVTLAPEELAGSFLHLSLNRLLRFPDRLHEAVIYDFLHRLALSRKARERRSR